MKAVIDAIDRDLIESELSKDKFLRKTNNGNNEIYIVTQDNSPYLLKEIGRLRELSFRSAGGGTGKDCDLDHFDIDPPQYKQLLVWNPDDKEIIGAYRYIKCKEALNGKNIHLATADLFHFSDTFIKEYFPHTIELGRSFVQPFYQPVKNSRKGMFSLANLWDGLGALIIDNPDIQYFFGKVTMYPHLHIKARDMILFFLHKYFPDTENLVNPIIALPYTTSISELNKIFSGSDYDEDYKILSNEVRQLGETIPPLINAYMKLSKTMKIFGTAINKEFGDVYETGLLINLKDIFDVKIERHLTNYNKL
ncbi:MAG: GNAT family N-acetyltransferase [Bacteroidales bacterium]|nr:GNAT family N-acetyltransferase [Bacteroidales bacterium]